MANTSWHKGVEDIPGPGGQQIPLANHLFVDHSYVGVSDGSPDAPYRNATDLISGETSISNKTVIIASGTYENDFINIGAAGINTKLIANVCGSVTFRSTVTTNQLFTAFSSGTQGNEVEGIKFIGYRGPSTNAWNVQEIEFIDCSFDNLGARNGRYTRCVFLNNSVNNLLVSTSLISEGLQMDNCIIRNLDVDSTFVSSSGKDIEIRNSYIDSDCVFDVTDFGDRTYSFTNCMDRGATQSGSKSPTEVNPVPSDDPLFVGSPENYEFLIEPSSPLIGAGTNNSTIGNFKIGPLVDLSSPVENNDIDVGPPITIGPNAQGGNIKPQFTVFSQIRKSPIVCFNGFLENNDINIPSYGNDLLPSRFIVEVTYKSTFGGSEVTGLFIYGLPMFQDDSGRTTGEKDFNPFDISSTGDILNNADLISLSNLIDVAEIQPNFTIINRFSPENGIDGDGVDDYLENQLQDIIVAGNEWSVVFWAESQSNGADAAPVFYNKKFSDASLNNLVALFTGSGGQREALNLSVYDGSGVLQFTINTTNNRPFNTGDSTLVCITMRENAGNYDYYLYAQNLTEKQVVSSLGESYKADNFTGFLLNKRSVAAVFNDNKYCHFWFYEDFTTEEQFDVLYNQKRGNYPESVNKIPRIDVPMDTIDTGTTPDSTPDESGNGNDFELNNYPVDPSGNLTPC